MNPARKSVLSTLLAMLAAVALVACGSDDPFFGGDEGGDSGSDPVVGTTTDEDQDVQGETPSVAIVTQSGFNAQEIFAKDAPGVVTIRSIFGAGSGLGAGGGQGSGFVINTDGEIVTNAHVVTDGEASGGGDISAAEEVFVEFSDRNQVPAEIVGFDANADIALLKIEPDGLDLNPLEFGDSDELQVGTPVAAIGSPFGQDQSMSLGIVSATDRSIESLTDFRIDGGIQTDASINPGNSGGPLITGTGEVIGVNQQINTTSGGNEGVGFAVPSNLVQRSIDDLRDDGEAEYAFIGVSSIPLYPQLADKLDIPFETGSLIVEVTDGSPAGEAGLRGAGNQTVDFQGAEIEVGGDVIVAVEGEELQSESDLSRLISQFKPGDEVEIEIIRDGDRQNVDVTLAPRPSSIG